MRPTTQFFLDLAHHLPAAEVRFTTWKLKSRRARKINGKFVEKTRKIILFVATRVVSAPVPAPINSSEAFKNLRLISGDFTSQILKNNNTYTHAHKRPTITLTVNKAAAARRHWDIYPGARAPTATFAQLRATPRTAVPIESL